MPIVTKEIEPKKSVPFAKSPEFAKLQDAISQAKEALDDVSRQIVAIESKLNPTVGKPGEDAMSQAQAAQSTTPDGVPIPMAQRGFEPDPAGQTFEESIEEMRRIAGLR